MYFEKLKEFWQWGNKTAFIHLFTFMKWLEGNMTDPAVLEIYEYKGERDTGSYGYGNEDCYCRLCDRLYKRALGFDPDYDCSSAYHSCLKFVSEIVLFALDNAKEAVLTAKRDKIKRMKKEVATLEVEIKKEE